MSWSRLDPVMMIKNSEWCLRDINVMRAHTVQCSAIDFHWGCWWWWTQIEVVGIIVTCYIISCHWTRLLCTIGWLSQVGDNIPTIENFYIWLQVTTLYRAYYFKAPWMSSRLSRHTFSSPSHSSFFTSLLLSNPVILFAPTYVYFEVLLFKHPVFWGDHCVFNLFFCVLNG